MAELTSQTRWSSLQTRSQFAAIAWLRWRITVNSFRRKGGSSELIVHIFIYLIFAAITLFLVVGAAFAANYLTAIGHLDRIAWLLSGTFILCQFLNVQLGQPRTTFDPTQLIRFPLRLSTYTSIRLFFGLLSPANIVGTLISIAIAIGIAIAIPSLWLYALIALTVFAATNVFFSRMVFIWVDRWLSTRRAREVFTGLIFALSLVIQWANFNFNPAYNHGHSSHTHRLSPQQLHALTALYHRAHPLLAIFPPELATTALLDVHHSAIASFFTHTLACALFAALFLIVFALRMRAEFHGENLSDAANGAPRSTFKATPRLAQRTIAQTPVPFTTTFGIPPVIVSMLGKEFLYLRRHMGILYGLIMPILLVLIFAGKFASRSNSIWIFPAAVGYTLLAIAPLSYNAFGFEGAGSQLYFLAPVRMRDILLAKNLFSFLMALTEIILVFAIITYISGLPPLRPALASVLWAAGTLTINSVFGNRRSFTTPKKINPMRMTNKQTSQVSALISLGVLALSAAVAAGLFLLCETFRAQWLIVPLSALLAATGFFIYIQELRSLDSFALAHREPLFAELCKQT